MTIRRLTHSRQGTRGMSMAALSEKTMAGTRFAMHHRRAAALPPSDQPFRQTTAGFRASSRSYSLDERSPWSMPLHGTPGNSVSLR